MPTTTAAKPDSRACAACRHQRRKCRSDCQWAEFFPATLPQTFANARTLYGLRNMNELTRHLPPELRRVAMETIIFESNVRAFDRIGGCYSIVRDLATRVRLAECELRRAHELLAFLRGFSGVENNNLGSAQKSSHLLHDYFMADDMGASTSSCRVDEHSGTNPQPGRVCRSDQPLNFLDDQMTRGTVPAMEGTSSMYNNRIELNPSSMAPQLCLPSYKPLKTDEEVNWQLQDSVYKRDQKLELLELKSLNKINKRSRPVIARDELDEGRIEDQ